MTTVLGLDAGGSKTAWVLLGEGGQRLAAGSGAGVQLTELGPERAAARLTDLIAGVATAQGAPLRAVAAVAGAGAAGPRAALQRALAGSRVPVRVTGDIAAAAAAALAEAPGVAVWAGTGSFAVARDDGGRLHRVGGRGAWISDEGSAHDLVREAARAAVRAADRLGPETAAAAALVARFQATEPALLGVAMARREPAEIAAALPDLLAVAGGDPVVQELLAAGGRRLAELALAAARAAGLAPAGLRVAFGGSVLLHAAAVREACAAALMEAGVRQPAQAVVASAAAGAARLAWALARGEAPLAGWVDA